MSLLFSLLLVTTFAISQQASLPTDSHYTAGVVEFRSSDLADNLKAYLQIIASDEASATDIIVFPEMTLTGSTPTYAPNATDRIVPCAVNGVYEDYLKQLSCAARNASKYIVVNVPEKENCLDPKQDPRPCSGHNVFNTNVVFDRSGAVISRYRKVNLYGERRNTTYRPEYGYFDTDFGVRFGHFICFDLLFYTPAEAMAREMGIMDFIFPTMWFSQLPFLTAVQIQSAWSYANDANLLAAGASNPQVGSTGSGIYAGHQGPLVAVINTGVGERQLYVARVPKKTSSRHRRSAVSGDATRPRLSADLIKLKRDYLETYQSVPLYQVDSTETTRYLCFGTGFCCYFELSWHALNATKGTRYYTYRMGILDGWRNDKTDDKNYLKNCAVFACTGDGIDDCGKLFESSDGIEPQFAFDRLLIQTEFEKPKQLLIMPNSLKDDLMPVEVNKFQLNVVDEGSYYKTSLLLNTTTENLLTFATYANYFDNEDDDDDGAAALTTSTILMSFAVMAGILMQYY